MSNAAEKYEVLEKSMVTFFKGMETKDSSYQGMNRRDLIRLLAGWIDQLKDLWASIQADSKNFPEKDKIKGWIAGLEAELSELKGNVYASDLNQRFFVDLQGKVKPGSYQMFFDRSAWINQFLRYIGNSIK